MSRITFAAVKIAILAGAVAAAAILSPAPASASPWCGVFHFDVNCWR